jgi:hypothetical protein
MNTAHSTKDGHKIQTVYVVITYNFHLKHFVFVIEYIKIIYDTTSASIFWVITVKDEINKNI